MNAYIDAQMCEIDRDVGVTYQEEPIPRVSWPRLDIYKPLSRDLHGMSGPGEGDYGFNGQKWAEGGVASVY